MSKKIKKYIAIACAILISSYSYSQSYCGSTPVDVHGDLSVLGNKIVDQNNTAVSFAGNSLFWSNNGWGGEGFYNGNVVSWLKDDWGATIVRAAMGVEDSGGYISDSSNKDKVKTVVDAAIAEGLYVIIDWHSHHAEDYQNQAVEFFKEMATLYGNYPNVIYEVYNEPIYSSWSNDIKPYAEAVISEIRAIDSDNLIIVGTPTWSQDVDVASNDPIRSSTNIAYTLHFYAGTHTASLRAKAQTALNNGIALMVTEWGTVNANGDGGVSNSSTDQWMDFLSDNDISHLNWSVNDKSEGASILRSGASKNGNWSDSDLTDSGLKVKNIIESWKQYCDEDSTDDNTDDDDDTEGEDVFVSVPAKIEAEDFDNATEGREETVGSVTNIGWIDDNEYLSYNINVASSGEYTIDFRLASETSGSEFDIYEGNTNIGSISTEATGGWQTWDTVSVNVSLSSGDQTLRIVATAGGWNIDWLEVKEVSEENTDDDNDDSNEDDTDDNTDDDNSNEDDTDTSDCGSIQTWDANAIYSEAGTQVIHNNIIYENKWYTRNQNPEDFSSNSWDLWTVLGSCDNRANKSLSRSGFNVTSFPNPFIDTLNISANDTSQTIGSLQLVDLSGKILISESGTTLHNLGSISNGVYLVQVLNTNNEIITVEKVIK